jgi:hypothetical protein
VCGYSGPNHHEPKGGAIEFFQSRSDDATVLAYIDLFRECFPTASQYTKEYLTWLYRDNSAGHVIGFDAWDGSTLAAHYACIPAALIIGGTSQRGLLSLNTATRPSHQGKGLFTRLADATYASGAAQGFSCVYGIANANSTPGFVRKLGFQLVRPLDALIGVGPLGIRDLPHVHASAGFRKDCSGEYLTWRVANPTNPVGLQPIGAGCLGAAASTHRYGVVAWSELPGVPWRTVHRALTNPLRPRLFLGLLPASVRRSPLYRPIPDRLRPSPLNLIFRNLGEAALRVDAANVFLTFLDFDAY